MADGYQENLHGMPRSAPYGTYGSGTKGEAPLVIPA